jgi:hypothetical protein
MSTKDATRRRAAIPVVIAWKDDPPDLRELKPRATSENADA